jgi:hypothetical protein
MPGFLTHPAIRGIPMGEPAWFAAQREMINQKRCQRTGG